MPLGWIDFSKTERNKVLSVLDLLSEQGTLDELGIAPVRDGFSELFFPGTTTIQTRAKYFFIVPYALKDMEQSKTTTVGKMVKEFDDLEQACGKRFLENNPNEIGIIGSRSLSNGGWVKRTPADVYWAGLRKYGIFLNGSLSLSEYLRAICALKADKDNLLKLGNRNDASRDEFSSDDKDAGTISGIRFWDIPTYHQDWFQDLRMELTSEEGAFLKQKMISHYPDSMLSYVLTHEVQGFFDGNSFQDMKSIIHLFPEQIQVDYQLAYEVSDFLDAINTQYNLILSNGENEEAVRKWAVISTELKQIASVDLDAVFQRLQLQNHRLYRFLKEAQDAMLANDVDRLQKEIRRRERELKTTRAKTLHPGEFDTSNWYGVGVMDYRFSYAKVILNDIKESEEPSC